MKTSTFTILSGMATLAAAQFPGLPTCADSCVLDFVSGSQIAGCSQLDIACICSNGNFLSSIACCLASSCSVADQQAATSYAINLCKTNGVTNLPTAVSCSTASPATTAASSTTAATTTEPATSVPAAASSSADNSIVGVGSAATPPSNGTLSTSSVGSGSNSITPTAASTTAQSPSFNAADQNLAGIGVGLVGGLVVIAALL